MSKRRVPYGYKLDSLGRQIEDPETMPFLQDLLEWVARGITSPSMLATLMKQGGAPTQRGGAWRPSTIKALLKANDEGIARIRLQMAIDEQARPQSKVSLPSWEEFEVTREYRNEDGRTVVKTEVFDLSDDDGFELGRLRREAVKYFADASKFNLTRQRCFEALGFGGYETDWTEKLLMLIEDEEMRTKARYVLAGRLLDLGTLSKMCLIAIQEKKEADEKRYEADRERKLWEERAYMAERILAAHDAKPKRRRA